MSPGREPISRSRGDLGREVDPRVIGRASAPAMLCASGRSKRVTFRRLPAYEQPTPLRRDRNHNRCALSGRQGGEPTGTAVAGLPEPHRALARERGTTGQRSRAATARVPI